MAGLMAGNGINGYFSGISNDSATLNNDDTIDMQQAWSAFIGYQHLWNDKLRSQISWRHDSIEKNLDRWNSPSTEGDTLQANLIWAVNAQLHAGFEYQYSLLNETTARDQEDHSLMFSLMYRFF